MHQFRLYIVGKTKKSVEITDSLKALLKSKLTNSYELVVIDLLAHPHKAAVDDIIVTPTLVRAFPTPIFKIIGDMTDQQEVKRKLNI